MQVRYHEPRRCHGARKNRMGNRPKSGDMHLYFPPPFLFALDRAYNTAFMSWTRYDKRQNDKCSHCHN